MLIFSPHKWSPWLARIIIGFALLIILAAITYACSNLKMNTIIDIFTAIAALIAIFCIAKYFYKESTDKSKTNEYNWLAITLIISVLAILFGVVIYNPDRQTLPIKDIEICGCAISFQQMTREAGISACSKIDDTFNENGSIKLENFINDSSYFSSNMKERIQMASISYKDMLKLCCAKNADDYIKILKNIKYQKIKNKDAFDGLLEAFILDEMAISILQKALSSCSCETSTQNCNLYVIPHSCDQCLQNQDKKAKNS